MEALNSALLGVVGSLLRKLDELPSTEDDRPRQLREDLCSIRTKLVKLSEVHDPPQTVSCWMMDARELSYDMEDFVDHQFVHASGADAETDRVNQRISGFTTRVDNLIGRYNDYNLEYYCHGQTTNTLASHRLPVVHRRERVLVGIDGPVCEILRWLKPKDDDSEKPLKVLCIRGDEGVGKNTLAYQLWRELEGDFECRAFIHTANKKADLGMILTNIISQVRPERPPENFQVANLRRDITKHLQDKRYLIVIDDLWAVPVWDALRRAFPDNNCGSRIVTTSTTEDIAMVCCSLDPENIFRLKPLCGDDSKRLFIGTAFGSPNGCPLQVNDNNLDKITKKCGGLPLALICSAAVVATLPETEHQLKYFMFLCNSLSTNYIAIKVLNQVLELCYNILPHSLKTCLLYLSVYPMSYTFLKEDLVKQWMAEGFICTLDGMNVEEVASSYFDELVNLNLIHRMDISNCDKKKVSYRAHPVVHDFITCNSMKGNFITVLDSTQSTDLLNEKIRRLVLHFGSATYATTIANTELPQVRSFAYMGLISCMPSLEDFKLVRVIILHFQDDYGDTTLSLIGIRKLLLLRYLQVRSRVTVILPDQVQCLQHLETLEINAVVAAVPSDIVNHPSLKHVCLGRKMKHNHLSMGPDTSDEAVFENLSDIISSASLQKLELLPPICSFSRLPAWVQILHGLRILEIVVRELPINDVEYLSDLPSLTAVSLYVREPAAVTFRTGAFPVLKYLKLVSDVLLLRFQENALCNLEKLKIGFNTHRGENFGQILGGIHHLLKLQVIVASIGAAVESDKIAALSALREAISKHPCPPSYKVSSLSNSMHDMQRMAATSSKQSSIPDHKENDFEDLELVFTDAEADPIHIPYAVIKSITYNFKKVIGSGGFGTVYMVAVKKLECSKDLSDTQFLGEVQCLKKVKNHKNIVRFLGYCADTHGVVMEIEGKHHIVDKPQRLLCFEYVPAGNLHDYIEEKKHGYEWNTCYQIIKGICQGLHYLHQLSIIHLDLKPANVLLGAQMEPKITDFGLSRCIDGNESTVFTNNKVEGTLGYIAPELYDQKGSLKSDIYSLGMIMTRLLTGSNESIVAKIVLEGWMRGQEHNWSQLRQIKQCIELAEICTKHEPENRPAIGDILIMLEETEAGERSLQKSLPSQSREHMQRLAVSSSQEPSTQGISM